MTFPKINVALGRILVKMRKERGWSQEFLGFECGLARNYVSLLERGERSPTLTTIFKICSALQISEDEFIKQVVNEVKELDCNK